MARHRTTNRGLTNSRIYIKRKRYYLFTADYTISPIDGKARQWHSLCLVTDGEASARELAQRVIKHNTQNDNEGNFITYFKNYTSYIFKKRDLDIPTSPPRILMHETGTQVLKYYFNTIEQAFKEFNIIEILPVDVASFIDQWEGKRTAQIYQSRLSDFFKWACRKGYCTNNPCREITVIKPKKRSRYITDEEFNLIKDAMLTGPKGEASSSGKMLQCYVDLCYLLYQRTTEIRLLRWDQITEAGILFTPTKTEKSSGANVLIPISSTVLDVLERSKQAYSEREVLSEYVIHTSKLKPYTTKGMRSAWARASKRAGIKDATLKDIRAKAMTDANKNGYTIKQISIGGAHTNEAITEGYIKRRQTPTSEVVMKLPE
jgi:integrase